MTTATTVELYLIAERHSHGEQHVDPVNPRRLSTHETKSAAVAAGRAYLAEHPEAWLQTDDGNGAIADVS